MAKILVVEDSPTWILISRKALEAAHDLTIVTTIAEGLAAVQREAWDLIILDLHLPDSLGHETLGKMIAVSKLTPILITTGDPKDAVASTPVLVDVAGKDALADLEYYLDRVDTLLEQRAAVAALPHVAEVPQCGRGPDAGSAPEH